MNLIQAKSKIRILLADDHPLVRKGLKALIESLNLSVEIVEASDGQQALDLADRHSFDLFILDIKMPVLDGYDLTRFLLKRNPNNRIIIFTMYSEATLIRSLFWLGVKGFLVKNSDIEDIEDAIHSVVAGDLYYDDSFRDIIQKELRSDSAPRLKFTNREMQLISLLSRGKTSKEIAEALGLTLKTIETYRSRVLDKAGVKNTSELLSHCHNNGLL